VIEQWKAYGQLTGDQSETEFAAALEDGFRSQGWRGALTKGVETREAQRKANYWSSYTIATLYADLGDKEQAFRWLDTAYQERDAALLGLKTDYLLDSVRSDPRFPELVKKLEQHSSETSSASSSSTTLRLPHKLEAMPKPRLCWMWFLIAPRHEKP